jgi:hypothetical protein
MKKLVIVMAALLLTAVLAVSFAEQKTEAVKEMLSEAGKGAQTAVQEQMTGKGQMMMCPMHHMMMGAMMSRSVVATEDGGIVVAVCEKLMKFDKDLNLVKEVQMPIDTEAMQKKMTQMMEKCPMCKGMMPSGMMKSGSAQ